MNRFPCLPSVSPPERRKEVFVSLEPGNFPSRLNVTVHAQLWCVLPFNTRSWEESWHPEPLFLMEQAKRS
jgi:hypothetical protein